MPSDIFNALTDFRGYATNRLNPITTRTGIEPLTSSDKNGHLRTVGDQVKDLIQNMVPIPGQGVVNRVDGNSKPDDSLWDSAASTLGLTTHTNISPAEQLSYRLASARSGTGAVPDEQLNRHHTMIDLEDRLRKGDPTAHAELSSDYAQGRLSVSDVKSIQAAAKETRLQASVSHLPMGDVLDVWNLSTDQERKQMLPTVVKKMSAFRKTEYQKLTPTQRNRMDARLARVTPEMTDLASNLGQ